MFKKLSTGPYSCGETPLWTTDGFLYWVDAASHTIYRAQTAGGDTRCYRPDLPVTAIRKDPAGGFILLTKWGLARWNPDQGTEGIVSDEVEFLDSSKGLRFNDGVPTGDGGFIAGAFNENDLYAGDGVLMYLRFDGGSAILGEDLHVPNGVAITPDGKRVLMSEMYRNRILQFPVHEERRLEASPAIWAIIDPEEGKPDGLTFDRNGFLWLGHWRGGMISCYDSNGQRIAEWKTPFPSPTCICFDSENNLYVTSATLELSDEILNTIEYPGGVFTVSSEQLHSNERKI